MNTVFQLPAQPLPCDDTYDVIVVGGGPAGCTAAIAAAREGAKTLLIEATGCLGGAATAGLVPAWCPFSDQQQIIYRGLAQRVFEACKRGMPHVTPDALDWVPIDHELLKRIYDDLVTESGADVLFLTTLAAVVRDARGTVIAAIVCNKAGLTAYRARVFVDCTGDADLAARAGAEVMKGDAQGDLQPATHCFVLAPVDEAACVKGPSIYTGNPESPVHRIVASGRYPHIPEAFACVGHKGYGVRGFNAGHVYHVDGTDQRSVSNGLIEGRKIASEFRDGLAEFFPEAFSHSQVVATGDTLGIRETRRITGDYMLDYMDWLARRTFGDEICRNCYCIDLHLNPEGLKKMQDGRAAELGPIGSAYGPGESHGIPYRCLTPRGLKNVLVAGRPISCDRLVHGSVRVMPVCLCTGEAAGMAAAHAAQSATRDVHAVDTVRLRQRLREEGAYLP